MKLDVELIATLISSFRNPKKEFIFKKRKRCVKIF